MMQYYDLPLTFLEFLAAFLFLGIPVFFVFASRNYGRTVFLAVFTAFFLRALVACLRRFDFLIPAGRNDVLAFEGTAALWAESGCLNLWEHFNPSASYVYSFVVGNIYSCIGRLPLTPHLLNVGLSVASVYFIARTANVIAGRKAMERAAWISAVFPTLIWYSTTLIREPFVVLSVVLGVYYAAKWVRSGSGLEFLMSLLWFAVGSLFHGAIIIGAAAMVLYAGSGLYLELLRAAFTRRISLKSLIGIIMFPALLAVMVVFATTAQLSKIGTISDIDSQVETIEVRSVGGARGGAAYPSYLTTEGFVGIALLTPVRLLYFMYGPPVWDIRAVQHIAALLDSLLYLYMSVLIWKNRDLLYQHRELVVLFVILLILALVFAWGTNNFGTGLRHKAKFVSVLIILVSSLKTLGECRICKTSSTALARSYSGGS